MLPHVSRLLHDDTHRLIPSAYDKETVLNRLTTDSDELTALLELEGATNERLLGEAGFLPGITVHELVFGLSYSHIVNAAFTSCQAIWKPLQWARARSVVCGVLSRDSRHRSRVS